MLVYQAGYNGFFCNLGTDHLFLEANGNGLKNFLFLNPIELSVAAPGVGRNQAHVQSKSR